MDTQYQKIAPQPASTILSPGTYHMNISGYHFQIQSDQEVPVPANLLLFEKHEDKNSGIKSDPEFSYRMHVTTEFPSPKGTLTTKREDLAVYTDGGLESRYISIVGSPESYGCYQEECASAADVYVLSSQLEFLQYDAIFCSLLALERHVIREHALILHSAYIEYEGRAILFSAPSGTGKTTHSDLWNKYLGSRTVNGDKALLQKKDGIWYACGWPACGTSEICHNESYPIHAVVMLHQSAENHVRALSVKEAFFQIYGQITINSWNTADQGQAISMIEEILGEVPVLELGCDISEDAVICLHGVLFPDK